ncbi:hypothetical protein niasHS_010536 [Heterodera schachtii]|uniref:Uncharacterized protein n=1 Tax=Heterodera schachtii TaxID=97005 RepID=A0ABD2IRV1_HETSC
MSKSPKNNSRENCWQLAATIFGALLQLFLVAIPKDFIRLVRWWKKSVKGQTVVITGGGSGIGQQIAELFADPRTFGAKVAIIDINLESAKKVTEKICENGGVAKAWKCDISDTNEIRRCAAEIQKIFGRVDIVLCSAALLYVVPILELNDADIQRSMDVNAMGTINTIRAFLPEMEARGKGHIVAMGSIASHFGEVFQMAYSPTKFAVRGAMECLRVELRERGLEDILCTTIYPFYVRTPMVTSKGLRPVARWLPFLTVEKCAKSVVDAILKEKVNACIPWWLNSFVALNGIIGINMNNVSRDFLDIHFEPSNDEDGQKAAEELEIRVKSDENGAKKEDNIKSAINSHLQRRRMSNFHQFVGFGWFLLIPPGIAFLSLLTFCHQLFAVQWLGIVGQNIDRIGSEYPRLLLGLTLSVWLLHFLLAVCALHFCHALRLTHRCALFWFCQTLLLGVPPLLLLWKAFRRKTN